MSKLVRRGGRECPGYKTSLSPAQCIKQRTSPATQARETSHLLIRTYWTSNKHQKFLEIPRVPIFQICRPCPKVPFGSVSLPSSKLKQAQPADPLPIVTGCSSGIGADICKYVVSQGHRLVATARKVEALNYLEDSPSILKLPLDVTSEEARAAALNAALEKFGRIDVLCNNAGYGLYGDTEALTEEQMRNQMETNFWGALSLTREAVRIFREVNPKSGNIGGTVVQVSSIGGRAAFPGGALYHAS
jgi:short chain dehydrogenase